jgi:hypothetical protein
MGIMHAHMHRDMHTEYAAMHAVQQQQYIRMCHERWHADMPLHGAW